jgi:hypothetical protein
MIKISTIKAQQIDCNDFFAAMEKGRQNKLKRAGIKLFLFVWLFVMALLMAYNYLLIPFLF